jgi:PII-like signaling protein
MTSAAYGELMLHKLKKIEIVLMAEDHVLVEELLKAAGIGGWTIIRDVAGMGHGGFHQGKSIFNDQSGLVMFVGVAEEKAIADVARGLARLFEKRPGVTFLSDVEVMRSDYFAKVTA